jgi:hypothetical protein
LAFVIFSGRCFHFCLQLALDLPMAGTTGRKHHTWLVDWDMGLTNFFPGLSLNSDPLNPCLLSSWNHSHEVLCPVRDNVFWKVRLKFFHNWWNITVHVQAIK